MFKFISSSERLGVIFKQSLIDRSAFTRFQSPKYTAEMIRACRPGGTIGLFNRTPDGFIGELLGLVGKFIPADPNLYPPTRWGYKFDLENIFDMPSSFTTIIEKKFNFRYNS